MAVIVVGGNTRNIGKTSVVAGLIACLPEFRWTAIKITQSGHELSADGPPGASETRETGVTVSRERDASSGTDTARFLAAGAERVFWVRVPRGRLAEAMPLFRAEIAAAANTILESNSVLEFLEPDLYLTVIDPATADFKESARRFLPRADAILCSARNGVAPPHALDAAFRAKPCFTVGPPAWISGELAAFVRGRLGGAPAVRG